MVRSLADASRHSFAPCRGASTKLASGCVDAIRASTDAEPACVLDSRFGRLRRGLWLVALVVCRAGTRSLGERVQSAPGAGEPAKVFQRMSTQSDSGSSKLEIGDGSAAFDERLNVNETLAGRVMGNLMYESPVEEMGSADVAAEMAWAVKTELVWLPSAVLVEVREQYANGEWASTDLVKAVDEFLEAVKAAYASWVTESRSETVRMREIVIERFETELQEWEHVCPSTWELVDVHLTNAEENILGMRAQRPDSV
jgi:hypothetical protein